MADFHHRVDLSRMDVTRDVTAVALRTSPGGVATAVTWGQHMGLIVACLSAVFLALQIAHFVWKWRREWTKGAPS